MIFRGPDFLAVVSLLSAKTHGLLGCGLQTVSGIWHPGSMLHVVGYSTVADLPIPTDSGGPATDDISAAVIPDVNGVPFLHASTFSSVRFY
jgi:hypothetical protein